MTVSYDTTTHYSIRYYRDGSDTSSSQVEQHAAETIDTEMHNIQTELTEHKGVEDGTVHGINQLINTALSGIIYSLAIPILVINAGVSAEVPLWVAPAACTLQKISVIPKVAITGADTDNMILSIMDKGSAGTGADTIVALAFPLGTDAAVFVPKDLGILSATHKVLAQGDVISFKKSESGSGMAMPDLVCVIEYKLN